MLLGRTALLAVGPGLGHHGSVIVRVRTAQGCTTGVRRPLENWTGTPWQGVTALDGRRGKDIVVGRQMGGSATFYQSLTWRHGRLVSLDAAGQRWGGFLVPGLARW